MIVFQATAGSYSFKDVLRHTFSSGKTTDKIALQSLLKKRYDAEAVILYHKGRAALAEAIRLSTGGEGKVAISGLTCYSVVQAVEAAGCGVVYVDIRQEDLHYGIAELEEVYRKSPDIKAVVIQNMLGIPSTDINKIVEFAKANKIAVIEDLAHCAGASYQDGREVGTVGDITMMSFGKDKAIDVVNGGALIIRKPEFAHKLIYPTRQVSLFDQFRDRVYPAIGWLTRVYQSVGLGKLIIGLAVKSHLVVRSADGPVDTNQYLPKWQAKLALRQMNVLDQTAARRRKIANIYAAALSISPPESVTQTGTAPIRYPLLVENRGKIIASLQRIGVFAQDIWYDVPVSPARYYDRAKFDKDSCPVATDVASRIMNLPTHQLVSENTATHIAEVVNKVAKQ